MKRWICGIAAAMVAAVVAVLLFAPKERYIICLGAPRQKGQGLVEYALFLALVAIVVIVAIACIKSTLCQTPQAIFYQWSICR